MAEILFVAPLLEQAVLAEDVSRQDGAADIDIKVARMEEGVAVALQAEKQGYQVIISRGVTAWMIGQASLTLPVVDVLIGGFDILKAYLEAKRLGGPIGIVDVEEIIQEVTSFEEIIGEHFVKCTLTDQGEGIRQGVAALRKAGVRVVIGKIAMANEARKMGMEAVIISSGREAVQRAVAEARRVLAVRRQEKRRTEQLKAILDFTYDGVLALDEKGQISVFNPVVERLSGWSAPGAIGRPVTEVLPKAHCLQVLKTGKAELGEINEIGGVKVVSNHIPIKVDHKVEGVVTTFQPIERLQRLEHKIRRSLAERGHVAKHNFADILGQSPVLQETLRLAAGYAVVDSTVLLKGPTGAGKEMFAQAIHNASYRRKGPFVAINCAALPENLLESELFGYVEGAFTGARKGGKAGVFEMAHGGTLFLDEVGEMAPSLQARLLRVLEEGEIMRIGDNAILPVNVRLVAATHRNLKEMAAEGRFREDLFYRLNVLTLIIPTLAARGRDILEIARYFLEEFCRKGGRGPGEFSPEAEEILLSYAWPGNIRELRNAMERLVMLNWSGEISRSVVAKAMLWEELGAGLENASREKQSEDIGRRQENSSASNLQSQKQSGEMAIIRRTLAECGGNKTLAAERLGVSRTTLWRKLQQL